MDIGPLGVSGTGTLAADHFGGLEYQVVLAFFPVKMGQGLELFAMVLVVV